MLLILRTVLAVLYCVLVCVFGSIYCLFRPRNPRNLATFAHLFGRMSVLFGIKVEQRIPKEAADYGTCIYIANHQNNYDMVTMSNVVQSGTVTVGKKSLLWVPLFGPLYWLTGNLLIDRDNRAKAHGTIAQVVEQVKKGMSPSGCSLKAPAAVAVVYCPLKPVLFMPLSLRVCQLCLSVSPAPIIST